MKRITGVLLLLLGIAWPATAECPTRLCSCAGPRSATGAVEAADHAFVARALSVRDTTVTFPPRRTGDAADTWALRAATLVIEHGWKGAPPDTLVLLGSFGGGADCLVTFRAGYRYLLYVREHEGQYTTTWCIGSGPVQEKQDHLRELGEPVYVRRAP